MNCNECSNMVFEFEDKALDAETLYLVNGHLQNCKECRAIFAAESKAMQSLPGAIEAELRDITLTHELQERIIIQDQIAGRKTSGRLDFRKFIGKVILPLSVAAGFFFLAYSNTHNAIPSNSSCMNTKYQTNNAVWIPVTLSSLSNTDARPQDYDTIRPYRDTYPLLFACISNQELRMARNAVYAVKKPTW